MTSNAHGGDRILGSLRSADGVGIVRIEDRYDTEIDDLWAALTDPGRLARWYGLPRFRKGSLGRQAALRQPYGRIHFCGDYTAQPGTPAQGDLLHGRTLGRGRRPGWPQRRQQHHRRA